MNNGPGKGRAERRQPVAWPVGMRSALHIVGAVCCFCSPGEAFPALLKANKQCESQVRNAVFANGQVIRYVRAK